MSFNLTSSTDYENIQKNPGASLPGRATVLINVGTDAISTLPAAEATFTTQFPGSTRTYTLFDGATAADKQTFLGQMSTISATSPGAVITGGSIDGNDLTTFSGSASTALNGMTFSPDITANLSASDVQQVFGQGGSLTDATGWVTGYNTSTKLYTSTSPAKNEGSISGSSYKVQGNTIRAQ